MVVHQWGDEILINFGVCLHHLKALAILMYRLLQKAFLIDNNVMQQWRSCSGVSVV